MTARRYLPKELHVETEILSAKNLYKQSKFFPPKYAEFTECRRKICKIVRRHSVASVGFGGEKTMRASYSPV